MRMTTPIQPMPVEELALRESDGLSVSLLWVRTTNQVRVHVYDDKRAQRFQVDVAPGQSPMDVFHHPYAYAPPSGTAAAPCLSLSSDDSQR
jgi:hypothetical protein